MPSYCTHIAHGILLLHLIRNFRPQEYALLHKSKFMAGLILPDAAKVGANSDATYWDHMMHYPNNAHDYFKTPVMNAFLERNPLNLQKPLSLGYAAHLYLDLQFDDHLKRIATFDIDESTGDGTCYIKNIGERWQLARFWEQVYEEYTMLNALFIHKYGILIQDFPSEIEIEGELEPKLSEWYHSLYDALGRILTDAEHKCSQVRTMLLDPSCMEDLIQQAAISFYANYLEYILK